MLDSAAICDLSVKTLDDNKALNLKVIDIRTLTDIADSMIVCTATSTRHASSLADKLIDAMRHHDVRPLGVEGLEESSWILVDLQDVIVHIMLAETREFYALEKLWEMAEQTRRQNEA